MLHALSFEKALQKSELYKSSHEKFVFDTSQNILWMHSNLDNIEYCLLA